MQFSRMQMKTNLDQTTPNSLLRKLYSNHEMSNKTMQDPYYEQFKFYLHLFRIFGRTPFETSPSGKLQVRYFSKTAVYCVVTVSLQLYLIYLVFLWQIPHIQKDGSFDNVISSLIPLLFLNAHYDIFLHSWWEAPKLVAYFESWKVYNVNFITKLGIPVPSRLSHLIIAVIFLSAIILGILILFETYFLLIGLEWYLCWPLFSVTYNLTMIASFWFINCLMICHSAEELNGQFVKVLESDPYRYDVYKFRFLILQLRNLTAEFGNVFSRTIVASFFISTLGMLMGLYGVVIIILQEQFDKLLSFLLPVFFGVAILFIFAEGAYRVSQKINHDTIKLIMRCDLVSLRQEVHQEIELILDTIKTTPVNIELLGLFVIHRSTIVQIFGILLSYMMVLAQFRANDENSSN